MKGVKTNESLLFLASTLLVASWYYVMNAVPTRTLACALGTILFPITSAPYVLWMSYDAKDRPEGSDRGFFLAFRVFLIMCVVSFFNLFCVVVAIKLFSVIEKWFGVRWP